MNTPASTSAATVFAIPTFTAVSEDTCFAANLGTNASYDVGTINSSGSIVTPTWPAVNQNIIITGSFRI